MQYVLQTNETCETYMTEDNFTEGFMTGPTMEIISPISMLIKGSSEMDSTALLLCRSFSFPMIDTL